MLSAVLGVVSELIVTVVADSVPAGVRTNFAQVQSWELLDGGGSNIVGGSAVSELYTTTVKAARSQQSRALFWFKVGPTNDNVLVIEFGDSRSNYHNGCLLGYIPFSGSEQLALTMPADFVAGSYNISRQQG